MRSLTFHLDLFSRAMPPRHRPFLDAVLADERGWRPLRLEPMTMLVFRHRSVMEFSRESFTFIAQGKRGKAP